MSGSRDRDVFLAELEQQLRVRGRARARILEEISAHLDQGGDNADVLAAFGAPTRLAEQFNDLHTTETASRVLGWLLCIAPALFATYVASFLIAFLERAPSASNRLTPRLYDDIDVVNFFSTVLFSTGFVAAVLTLAAFATAATAPPLRRKAVLGVALFIPVAVPPLAAIGYLAARDDPWVLVLAPAAATALLTLALVPRNRDRHNAAAKLASLALVACALTVGTSVGITVLNGVPAPTAPLPAIRYINFALLPLCIAAVARAYQRRLSGSANTHAARPPVS